MKYGWKFLHIDVFFQRTKPPFIEFRDFVLLQGTSMPAWWKIEPLASWTTARNPKNGDAYSLVREPKGRSSRAIWRRKWRDVGRLTIIFLRENRGFSGTTWGFYGMWNQQCLIWMCLRTRVWVVPIWKMNEHDDSAWGTVSMCLLLSPTFTQSTMSIDAQFIQYEKWGVAHETLGFKQQRKE